MMIFITNKGKAYSYKYLSNYITDIIYQTNLPFLKYKEEKVTPHSFRNFFAIYSRRQGADIYDI
jgi:site-specific recombinase XerD